MYFLPNLILTSSSSLCWVSWGINKFPSLYCITRRFGKKVLHLFEISPSQNSFWYRLKRNLKKILSSAQQTMVNVQTTSTNWKQVSHMLWPINLQTNTNGFLITYVSIRWIQFELASSKARITSVKSLKQESVIQSGSGTRVDNDRTRVW